MKDHALNCLQKYRRGVWTAAETVAEMVKGGIDPMIADTLVYALYKQDYDAAIALL